MKATVLLSAFRSIGCLRVGRTWDLFLENIQAVLVRRSKELSPSHKVHVRRRI